MLKCSNAFEGLKVDDVGALLPDDDVSVSVVAPSKVKCSMTQLGVNTRRKQAVGRL